MINTKLLELKKLNPNLLSNMWFKKILKSFKEILFLIRSINQSRKSKRETNQLKKKRSKKLQNLLMKI